MAQPNVAREPSMEEILASIRRIIEDNDVDGSDKSATPVAEEDELQEPVELTIDKELESMDGASYAEEAVAQKAPTEASAPSDKPTTLADIAARVHGNTQQIQREAAPAAPQASSPLMTEKMAGVRSGQVVIPSATIKQADAQNSAAPTAQKVQVEPAKGLSISVQPKEQAREVASVAKPLVSSETGARVAKSFDELSSALNSSKRSLDEIAEEMLRPMLQEWLDDNLPTMVERLVREEIERVARGPEA